MNFLNVSLFSIILTYFKEKSKLILLCYNDINKNLYLLSIEICKWTSNFVLRIL